MHFYMLPKTPRSGTLSYTENPWAPSYTNAHDAGLTAFMTVWNLTFQMAQSLSSVFIF